MQEFTDSGNYYYRLTLRHWKLVCAVAVIAALLAAIFSSGIFITPKFKSTALVYPANIKPYSAESESEQLLQLFQSSYVRDAVVSRFGLAQWYEIDTTRDGWKARIIAEYDDHVRISRTQFESVEISVLDRDPQRACDMVKEIIAALNRKAGMIEKDKAAEVVKVFADQLAFKQQQIDSLGKGLEELRTRYQLLDFKGQSREVTRAWMKSLTGNRAGLKDVDVMLQNLSEKGEEYVEMEMALQGAMDSYNQVKVDYDNARRDLLKEITYTHMITEPFPADKKSYPIRWLIVLVSVISSVLMVAVLLLWKDKMSKPPLAD